MKKVYTTIILFVSLFFFCSHNANAATYSFMEDNFNLLNDDFYKVKDLSVQFIKENNFEYFLIYYSSNKYSVLFFNNPIENELDYQTTLYYLNIIGDYTLNPVISYDYKDNSLIYYAKYSTKSLQLKRNSSRLDFSQYLYSNYSIINSSSNEIILSYNDYNYTIEINSKFPSLYQHYLNINGLTDDTFNPDIHEEEKLLLSNFYTLVIEKINLLANSIINNYIYLTVIGIFILIFLIYLIRRYLL